MARLTQRQLNRGITLVELLVVLAILSLLAAIAIPSFAAFGQFVSTDTQSTARTIYSTLRAARIYASTYRVDTAVVYSLDNYNPSGGNVVAPIHDNVANQDVRVINAFAVAFKCPATDRWLPLFSEDGQFARFEGESVVLLRDPDDLRVPIYAEDTALFDPLSAAGVAVLNAFGMSNVEIDFTTDARCDLPVDPSKTVPFPAHVFTPRGSIRTAADEQLFQIFVAPSPDENATERLIYPDEKVFMLPDPTPENPQQLKSNMVTIPIELYQATGRVRIGS